LLQFIELENYLSDLLGIRLDLVMKDTLDAIEKIKEFTRGMSEEEFAWM
jgi:predicted nucleotidyltransferase